MGCILHEANCIDIDMNQPNFEFYQRGNKLDFIYLKNLDTFLQKNKNVVDNYMIRLVGRENVKIERIDSVISVLQKHDRFRYTLIYQKGFWEK